jgi:chitinase
VNNVSCTSPSGGTVRVGLCLLIALSGSAGGQVARKDVIGYLPSWKWQSGVALSNPASIPYEKFTHINYAFFAPLPDGSIGGRVPDADRRYLSGDPESTLTSLAHRHGVKVLLSIGGWEDSDNFPLVASTDVLRRAFAHSCLEAVRKYNFDGIDIDWEFPGYREHGGGPADRRNFTLLLSALRDSLDSRPAHPCLLTAALPAGDEHLRNMEVEKIAGLLDLLNIMTYDYYGPWDSLANHNSPLYPSAGGDTARCVDASFRRYRDFYGVSPSKITIGIPFYGHAFADCVGLNTRHRGEDSVCFPKGGAFASVIAKRAGMFIRKWDDDAKVPYLISPARKMLVSYDDEESVRAKARYVLENGIHGVIIWEITADNMSDGTTPLLDALSSELASTSFPVH